jgi:AcrR family transcriptional regulator
LQERVRPYHHGDLRAALVTTALEMIDSAGPEQLTLSSLARALGVSQAAPYRHFADRAALLEAVAAEGFQTLAAEVDTAASGLAGRARLRGAALAYVGFGLRRAGLYQLMFASRAVRTGGEESELGRAATAAFAWLQAAIDPGPDRQLRALRIWAGLHGLVMLLGQGLPFGAITEGVSAEMIVESVVEWPGNQASS